MIILFARYVLSCCVLVVVADMQSVRAASEPHAVFTEAATVSNVDISYDDWSYILSATVFEAGRSDRSYAPPPVPGVGRRIVKGNTSSTRFEGNRLYFVCLLYTSDAVDDLLCVDLGGRRIIKKKINTELV
eukprot:TRINITY_DN6351_c0_g1_i1.p1 TRINITY_DN6351_c0_g1~~TRINITY_DN6351_c0_g1_i1.p1  ORF type:complete len:131 (-),score=18.69 TRINITY_DN6351_c0_g1_i1:8-400(-)